MKSEPKNCPFCGGKSSLFWNRGYGKFFNKIFFYCACEICGVRGKSYPLWHPDDITGKPDEWDNSAAHSALSFWNTRAGEEKE